MVATKVAAMMVAGPALLLQVFAVVLYSLLKTIVTIGCVLGAATAFLYRSKNVNERIVISMVALFRALPYLDRNNLENQSRRAWGFDIDFESHSESFVVGESPLYLIRVNQRVYAVRHVDCPYFQDTAAITAKMRELRSRIIMQQHNSWISVELLTPPPDIRDRKKEYAWIARLLNQLANEDALALLIPEMCQVIPWDVLVEQALNSDNPLSKLWPSDPPVIQVADDDPKMVSAVNKARRRWPEFVVAFENRHQDPGNKWFSVKAPITVGNDTEFIWINVSAIENRVIYGTLGNQPVSLAGLSANDRVRVSETLVNDWIYLSGSRHKSFHGGFTIKRLTDLANHKSEPCSEWRVRSE